MKQAITNRRYLWADVIRVVAIYLVIFVHSLFFLPPNTVGTLWMWIPYLYAQMGVPLFVMISGALLLGKDDAIGVFFQKRILAVLIPWVWWIVLYIIIDYTFHNVHPVTLHDWIRFSYEVFFSRLWFLPMIFGLYLLTPILKAFLKQASKSLLLYGLILWYFVFAFMPAVYKIFGVYLSLDSSLLRQVMQYSGLFVLGYLLAQKQWFVRPIRFWVTVFLISLSGTYLSVFLDSFTTIGAHTDPFFYRIFSPTMVPGIVAFFMVLFYLSKGWEKTWSVRRKQIIASCSQAALGIYLVHGIVQEVIASQFPSIDKFLTTLYPLLSVPLRTTLVFLISYLIILLLRRFSLTKIFT